MAAQHAPDAVRTARPAFLATAPKRAERQADVTPKDGAVMADGEGWSEEQAAENRRRLDAGWEELEGADRVADRILLKHLGDDAA